MSSIRNIKQYSADSAYSTTTAVSFAFFFHEIEILVAYFFFSNKKPKLLFRLTDYRKSYNIALLHIISFYTNRKKRTPSIKKRITSDEKKKEMIYLVFDI
jgi:hypothetical protein